MAAFSEMEQWYSDLDWYAVDEDDNIGVFFTGGNRSLPPRIARNKEKWQTLSKYFEELEEICNVKLSPDLQTHLSNKKLKDFERYISHFKKKALTGLYVFDTYMDGFKDRPYYLVCVPKKELKLPDLPTNISEILDNQRLDSIIFPKNRLISEELADTLK